RGKERSQSCHRRQGEKLPARSARMSQGPSNRTHFNVLQVFGTKLSYLDVFPEDSRAWFPREYVAVLIHGAELCSTPGLCVRITTLVKDEISHPTSQGVSDPYPLLKARVVDIIRLRVEHINQIFVIYREGDAARHPEL